MMPKSSNLFSIQNWPQKMFGGEMPKKRAFGKIQNHGKFVKGLWQTTLYWWQSKKRDRHKRFYQGHSVHRKKIVGAFI